MTANNEKHISTNEMLWIRLFSLVTFLSTREISVVFNISSSHAYTNLWNRRFQHKQILVSN